MEEDLESMWKKLSLTEEEEEGVVVPKEVFFEGTSWLPNCLLVSLLTKKGFNNEAFMATMEKIWRATPPINIQEVGENLFMFQFRNNAQREIVISGGPWNFDDRLVLLKPLERGDKPSRNLLNKAIFWIQIHGLPFMSMSEKVGTLLGKKLGRVIEVKVDDDGFGLGSSLRVRAELISESLLNGGSNFWWRGNRTVGSILSTIGFHPSVSASESLVIML